MDLKNAKVEIQLKCDINCVLLTGIARVKHACVTECDWLAKYGNYH